MKRQNFTHSSHSGPV